MMICTNVSVMYSDIAISNMRLIVLINLEILVNVNTYPGNENRILPAWSDKNFIHAIFLKTIKLRSKNQYVNSVIGSVVLCESRLSIESQWILEDFETGNNNMRSWICT